MLEWGMNQVAVGGRRAGGPVQPLRRLMSRGQNNKAMKNNS